METWTFKRLCIRYRCSSDPTYEAWKRSIGTTTLFPNSTFRSYLRGMETSEVLYEFDEPVGSDPTYEAWKPGKITFVCWKKFVFRSYLRGMETIPQKLFNNPHFPVPILPTRHGNFGAGLLDWTVDFGSDPTYEAWKPTYLSSIFGNLSCSDPTYEAWKLLGLGLGFGALAPFRSYLRGMETFFINTGLAVI